MVNTGSVLEVPFLPHVISPLSVSTSSCGKKRLILDLRYLNSHVFKEYIRFDDLRSFESYLNKDSFLYKFDLKKGYHHIDICSEHQTYLGFSWVINGELKYFVFTVLPFGLTSAPYIFTKVLCPILNLWHSRGIQISLFLDDGIGIEKCYEKAITNSNYVKSSLQQAGFVLNIEKSIWEPCKHLTWLGITIDLHKNKLFIPKERISSIKLYIDTILNTPFTSARILSRLVGKLISTKYVLDDIVRG